MSYNFENTFFINNLGKCQLRPEIQERLDEKQLREQKPFRAVSAQTDSPAASGESGSQTLTENTTSN